MPCLPFQSSISVQWMHSSTKECYQFFTWQVWGDFFGFFVCSIYGHTLFHLDVKSACVAQIIDAFLSAASVSGGQAVPSVQTPFQVQTYHLHFLSSPTAADSSWQCLGLTSKWQKLWCVLHFKCLIIKLRSLNPAACETLYLRHIAQAETYGVDLHSASWVRVCVTLMAAMRSELATFRSPSNTYTA